MYANSSPTYITFRLTRDPCVPSPKYIGYMDVFIPRDRNIDMANLGIKNFEGETFIGNRDEICWILPSPAPGSMALLSMRLIETDGMVFVEDMPYPVMTIVASQDIPPAQKHKDRRVASQRRRETLINLGRFVVKAGTDVLSFTLCPAMRLYRSRFKLVRNVYVNIPRQGNLCDGREDKDSRPPSTVRRIASMFSPARYQQRARRFQYPEFKDREVVGENPSYIVRRAPGGKYICLPRE